MSSSKRGLTSTARAARALGVSVSTVKRWVDDGILPAQKTAGGHRKVLIADVVNLARRGDLPHADLSLLLGEDKTPADGHLPDRLRRALLKGDGEAVRLLIVGAFRRGLPIADLADHAIAPAMAAIGREWEMGRIDVMEEHLASQLCTSALYEVKSLLTDRGKVRRPRAVGAAVEGDFSVLPTLLAQMSLLDAGWDAVNLGPNTPLGSLIHAIDELQPRLVWLSFSHFQPDEPFFESYQKFYRHAESKQVAVAIGGRALSETTRPRLSYTTHGDSVNHLSAFARTLHPPPRRPRRGRPPTD